MNTKQLIMNTVKDHFLGAVMINDLVEYLSTQGHNISRYQVLVHIRKTLHLHKGNRKSDLIEYIDVPELPTKYDDLLFGIRDAMNIEDLFFVFVKQEGYIPNERTFRFYCAVYPFGFDWNNSNNFQSVKKKIMHILRECGSEL